jgi:hypothetical protein
MTDCKDPSADYKVGKGRPPIATRFRPGKSGNPKGRPKRKKKVPSFLEALAERVEADMFISEKGRRKSVPTTVALAGQVVQRAFTSVKEAAQLVKLLQQLPADTETAGRERLVNAEQTRRKLQAMIEQREERERLESRTHDEP